ncbi:MAG: phosphatidylserine decarboxylase [Thermodesulfobacteriota bacterium]|nr:phosphatidylserine decarboxylase [Thermodesulfobacteriota bacterium]
MFDFSFNWNRKQVEGFIENMGIDMSDCVLPLDCFLTPRQVFQRKIRYWACRPMPEAQTEPFSTKDDIQDNGIVVSPADAKVLVGDLKSSAPLFIKGKFFEFEELLEEQVWRDTFRNGKYAIFRMTPDEYHYNHAPVTGWVADFYEINGKFHACNPGAVVREVTPYSKNTRVVTIFDTDIQGVTCVGRVAMIEVAAMIGGSDRPVLQQPLL